MMPKLVDSPIIQWFDKTTSHLYVCMCVCMDGWMDGWMDANICVFEYVYVGHSVSVQPGPPALRLRFSLYAHHLCQNMSR